ncbi:MAG: N-acetylneuraminate synthase family protein [Gemmatimonadota bacterium]
MMIGGRAIGPGRPCFVIAEAGVNHDGDPGRAHALIDAAAAAGVDAIKFQTFDPASLVAPSAPRAPYQVAATGDSSSQFRMLAELRLDPAVYPELADHALEAGLCFLSTPFDEESASMLAGLGVPGFKLASPDLVNDPLLEAVAGYGLPLILSTGMADLDECRRALQVARAAGAAQIALLHCVTDYPARPGDCNLRAMATLRRELDVPVGWSDHTLGAAIALAAVALGADIVEKHFTVDRTLTGPDHAASLEPPDLAELLVNIRDVEAALGDGRKVPAAAEADIAPMVRRSVHYRRDLDPGAKLTRQDLVMLRPGTGLPPREARELVGRHLNKGVRAGEMASTEDLRAP